ncbi:WcaI family glycosyltransferase [Plastorhodobacter daqingensis]|uniref:WcaI family glycosyltransferase n=1 Tax=Plastorhodobacter daqingensis TaxID=1387281 RepID=A0ABW2UG38_9RHOB
MRLLILGLNYAPEMIGIGRYTADMAEGMARRGHEVQVVTAQPYYPGWKVFQGYPRWRYSQSDGGGLRILRCPLYVPARPSGARRLLHHASFAAAALPALVGAILRRRPDLVLVIAPSLISALPGILMARLAGARTWLHVQDLEVDAAFATGLLPGNGWIARLARGYEGWILRRFDRVSTISVPMLHRLQAKGVAPDRLRELRNWADLATVTPQPRDQSLAQSLGVGTRYVALYSGNIANKQGLELLADAAQRLGDCVDLTFLVCGDGPFLPRLKHLCQGLNVVFQPLQPKDRLGVLLSLATVHLLPQSAGAADLVLPSKLTNMLASGRPVVATAAPGTALASEVSGCGLLAAPGDPEGFAQAIRDLVMDPALCARLGKAARARAEERWDGVRLLDSFEADAEALLAQHAPEAGGRSWQGQGH